MVKHNINDGFDWEYEIRCPITNEWICHPIKIFIDYVEGCHGSWGEQGSDPSYEVYAIQFADGRDAFNNVVGNLPEQTTPRDLESIAEDLVLSAVDRANEIYDIKADYQYDHWKDEGRY